MKKILLSLAMIAAVGAIVAGATGAFFSDSETSTGNTFTAGAIDLKIDFDGYYNVIPGQGEPYAHWTEKDLVEGTDKFFDFDDIKPGDFGEGTISLHVYTNDAWGKMVIKDVEDSDNTCTEPELEAEPNCIPDEDGELRENLMFYAWLDQGKIPGFQNVDKNGRPIDLDPATVEIEKPDLEEGDNIWQDRSEPIVIQEGTIDEAGEEHIFAPALTAAFEQYCVPNSNVSDDGHNDYGFCHGLARDGRLVGSVTYYMGIYWYLPGEDTGNEVQSDSLKATIMFDAEQHRNNP